MLYLPIPACGEAYTNDLGAVYACTVGCTVDVNTVIGDDGMTEVTMISNMMDLMLLSRLMDMLSVSSSSSVNDDSNSEWSDEVDVYVPEVCVIVCNCVCCVCVINVCECQQSMSHIPSG